MKKTNSIVSTLLIFLIIFSTIMPSFIFAEEGKIVHIKNSDDLIQLSKDCSFDRWSQGIKIVLDNDIDLKEKDFLPIPIFGGTFDGNGHTIRGLSIKVEGSNQGLFRYLQEGATIKDLSVEGVVTPSGEKSVIGGIIGNNKGTLENCNFSGLVKGKDSVGGLIGWNTSTGKVINSSFDGVIYGDSKVGGAVGYNSGTVLHCTNNSNVNTTVEDHKLDITDITLESIKLTNLMSDAIDVGGVVGFNIGIVQSAVNHGKVGYPHAGYNVGGIVGRQSGYVTKSVNHGNIYGRKEVAGIVGQVEPHISTIIGASELKSLERELSALDASITNMINDVKVLSKTTNQNLTSIENDIEESKSHVKSLIDQTEVIIDSGIEELNKISIIGLEVMDRLIPITEKLENTIKNMEKVVPEMEEAFEHISKIIEESAFLSEKFKEIMPDLEESILNILENKEILEKSYEDVLKVLESIRDGEMEKAAGLLLSIFEDLEEVSNNLEEEMSNLKPIIDEFINFLESNDKISKELEDAFDNIINAIEIMESAVNDIGGIIKDFDNLIQFIISQEDLEFETTNDNYEKTKEDLLGSINSMSTSLMKFMKDMDIHGNKIIDDLQAVNDQLFRVMNLMINIIEEMSAGDISKDDIIKDVSGDDIEGKTEGKISYCKNLGSIEGDLNVGGISGGMSIELLDPEKDLNLQGKLSYNTVFERRAIIFACENKGSIIAKKDNAGGIVGSMDLGYIKDCVVESPVKSIDGNYVGGIAGKSDAPIVSSYSRSTLEGGNYIGGISGLGTEIINSYTLVEINDPKACIGAIAGNIDENSNIKDNYFVSDELRGIDGISYMGKAEPITYEKLISIENIPNIFKNFQLSFIVEDEVVDTIDFNYGDALSEKDFPEIPSKEMHYSKWEEIDIKNITFDTDVHAVYTPYVTILESEEKRTDILPIILVEGLFTEEDSLRLIEVKREDPPPEGKELELEEWNLIIPEDGELTHTIRYFPPEGKNNLKVYILKDSKWKKTKAKWDGKYLVFDTTGNNIKFKIMDSKVSYIKYGFLLILIAISIFAIYTRRSKKTKAD